MGSNYHKPGKATGVENRQERSEVLEGGVQIGCLLTLDALADIVMEVWIGACVHKFRVTHYTVYTKNGTLCGLSWQEMAVGG